MILRLLRRSVAEVAPPVERMHEVGGRVLPLRIIERESIRNLLEDDNN